MPAHFKLTSCNFRWIATWISRELWFAVWAWGSLFWAHQFIVADRGFEVRNSKFKVVIFDLRVVGGVFQFISSSFEATFTNRLALWAAGHQNPENWMKFGSIKQLLRDNLKSCYAKFSLSEIRYLPLSRHNSCHFSSETHFTKLLLRGFYTTKGRVSMSIAISGDYMIKVNDRSTSTTTLIRLCANLSPKWIKTAPIPILGST